VRELYSGANSVEMAVAKAASEYADWAARFGFRLKSGHQEESRTVPEVDDDDDFIPKGAA
jgi:hypothetical protein